MIFGLRNKNVEETKTIQREKGPTHRFNEKQTLSFTRNSSIVMSKFSTPSLRNSHPLTVAILEMMVVAGIFPSLHARNQGGLMY